MAGIDNGERGARPAIVCPRCAWSGPPQEARLVTCPSCSMAFDSRRTQEATARPATRPSAVTRGTFRAPSMGMRAAPFPITGEGSCELGDDYLTVSGFRTRGALARFAVLLLGVALGIGLASVLGSIGMPDKIVAASGFGVFLVCALTPLPPSRWAVRFRIPYACIHGVTFANDTLAFEVRDFAPKGELYFATSDADELAMQITARRNTSRAS